MTVSQAAEVITRYRQDLKWSKRRLARESGLSPAYVVQLENGTRPVTAPALAKIADAFGIHPYVLLTEAGFIPGEATLEAERMTALAMEQPSMRSQAMSNDTGGTYAYLVADYLNMLGHDSYGLDFEGPYIVVADWSTLAPERWAALQERRVNAVTMDHLKSDMDQRTRERQAARAAAPTAPIEGWHELTSTQQRLVQQLVNQLRSGNAEGGTDHGDDEA